MSNYEFAQVRFEHYPQVTLLAILTPPFNNTDCVMRKGPDEIKEFFTEIKKDGWEEYESFERSHPSNAPREVTVNLRRQKRRLGFNLPD